MEVHTKSRFTQERYMADEQFTLRIRMIAADVIRNEYQAVADDVLEYFEDSYCGICLTALMKSFLAPTTGIEGSAVF